MNEIQSGNQQATGMQELLVAEDALLAAIKNLQLAGVPLSVLDPHISPRIHQQLSNLAHSSSLSPSPSVSPEALVDYQRTSVSPIIHLPSHSFEEEEDLPQRLHHFEQQKKSKRVPSYCIR